jgi:flagellin
MTILTTVGGTATTIAASTDDGASYVAGARAGTTSALALANAINAKTADTSVAATAKTEVTSGTVTGSIASSSGDLYINGQNIGAIAAVATVADRVAALVNAINGISGTTGVTAASVSGTTYKLTAADGRNIDVTSNLTTGGTGYNTSGFTVAAATGGVGGTAVTNYGQVTMTAGKAIDVGGTAVNGLADSALVGTTLSISTQANASTAITSLDAAINTVNTQRSTMGIAQTRLDSVISNLRTSSDNVGAARGRIRDTDFAKETASMTRNQVLQQAGVAMLAQANALPNLVLSLLK